MQKVMFKNAKNERLEISPVKAPYIFDSIKGIDASQASLVVHKPAGMDGALYDTVYLEDREITVNLHVRGRNAEDLYKKKQELIKITGSGYYKNAKLGEFWYQNDYGKWWIPAMVKQGARQIGRRFLNYIDMQIVFYCPSSAWRASHLTIDKMAFLSGGFKFPLKIPALTEPTPGIRFGLSGYQLMMLNDGDFAAPITIEITGTAVRPRIENKNTGEFIAVNRSLNAGDRLVISTEPGKKQAEIIRATGQKEDAMGYIDPSSTWFSLSPGKTMLEYTSGDDTTSASVIVSSYARYGGV